MNYYDHQESMCTESTGVIVSLLLAPSIDRRLFRKPQQKEGTMNTSLLNSEKYSTHLIRPAFVTLSLPVMIALALIATPAAQAQTFTVIHNFTGGADGAVPDNGLTMDAARNLYGTTYGGGAGYGTVFKLRHFGSSWVLAPLYNFTQGETSIGGLGRYCRRWNAVWS